MCTKYLYIVTHILEERKSTANFPTNSRNTKKCRKLSYKFWKIRKSAGNFPTHSGKYEKVQEIFLHIVEEEENVYEGFNQKMDKVRG